jgi:hypothetical protein
MDRKICRHTHRRNGSWLLEWPISRLEGGDNLRHNKNWISLCQRYKNWWYTTLWWLLESISQTALLHKRRSQRTTPRLASSIQKPAFYSRKRYLQSYASIAYGKLYVIHAWSHITLRTLEHFLPSQLILILIMLISIIVFISAATLLFISFLGLQLIGRHLNWNKSKLRGKYISYCLF